MRVRIGHSAPYGAAAAAMAFIFLSYAGRSNLYSSCAYESTRHKSADATEASERTQVGVSHRTLRCVVIVRAVQKILHSHQNLLQVGACCWASQSELTVTRRHKGNGLHLASLRSR